MCIRVILRTIDMVSIGIVCNTVQLRIIVGWVERSETQQMPENVGFRSSTQPTQIYFSGLTEPYWDCLEI